MKSTNSAHDYLQKAGNVSLEYLNIFKTKLASTVVDTVYAAENITKTVLPGNPVTREYEVTKHVGSAGPGLLWTLYNGYKKSTKQEATVFVLHKKSLESYSKKDRELIIEAFKKGATQLARIKHPRILSLQHQLEESKDSLAFATELCFCSLANALGQHDNMPTPIPAEIETYKLYEVEIKYGLMQLAEALAFIHKDVKILHRNICPESIVLNANGAWKLAGFELFLTNIGDPNDTTRFPFKEWDGSIPSILNQPLEYLAPEYGLSNRCDSSSDMFSYGMLFFSVFNNGKTLYNCNNSYQNFVSNVEQLRKIANSQMNCIPSDVREYLKMLMHINSELRPDASQVMKIPFFDDVAVKTLEYLDSSFQVDNLQKSVFFKSLPQIIDKLPQRVCLQRIIPCLEQEFINPDMIPFLLPSIFLIAEQSTNDEYVKYILPRLKFVFKLQKPLQVVLIVLRNMNLVLSKTPPMDIKEHILPMVCRALEAETLEIQELCLSTLPSFAHLIDQQSVKHLVIPRIRKICLESTSVNLRVCSLVCTGKLLEHLEKWIVLDDILPILEKITSRESAVLMAMLGIYKIVFSHPKLGISKDMLATRVLPYLIPLSIENSLNMSQSNSYLVLIREMLNQVENEHKKKMEQIEAMEKEKSIIPYTFSNTSGSKSIEPTYKSQDTMMDKIMTSYGLVNSSGSMPPPGYQGDSVLTQDNSRKQLTLKEKQNQSIKFENSQVETSYQKDFSSYTKSQELTESMINKNLSGLNTSSNIKSTPSSNNSSSFDRTSQQIHHNENSLMRSTTNYNINPNHKLGNNEFIGFFGNLALPSTSSTSNNSQDQYFNNLAKPSSSFIPLIPSPAKINNNTNPKPISKSAFDDLNDIFG